MPNTGRTSTSVTRREFISASAAAAVLMQDSVSEGVLSTDATAERNGNVVLGGTGPYQALGTRAGDVTKTSAIVWTRLTKHPQRNDTGVVFPNKKNGQQEPESVSVPVDSIEGACPGAAGRVRLRYGRQSDLSDAVETEWVDVSEASDFIHQFLLVGLEPDTVCHYVSQAAAPDEVVVRSEFHGRFRTAPDENAASNFSFCVMTCQGYKDRDHPDGHPIYPSMLKLDPRFITMTGDLVYYDNDAPRAVNAALARLHWERMFSLPRLVKTMSGTAGYWLKDDHDTLSNDSGPGSTVGELTFAEGQKIFRQQAPVGDMSYRTFRWGRDLQIWFTDGRDFRSPNDSPDGPEKTIWGAAQKAWFHQTVLESSATWKVLISPTPLVGPDRPQKNDNHSNAGFAHEGNEIREWLKASVPDNFFVVCGDRHWQYHSVHPTTGIHEFSVGAASDSHAGGTPGENREYHRFHRVSGGFLSVRLRSDSAQSHIAFRLHDVEGNVVYEAMFSRSVR